MNRLPSLIAFALAALVAAAPAVARELMPPERTSLVQAVDRFETAMRKHDGPAVVGVVPPRIIAFIAQSHGLTEETLRQSMVQAIDKVLASGIILAFDMDAAGMQDRSLTDGTPYVLIPTDTTLKAGDHKVVKHTNTLALMDDGAWYLVEVGRPPLVERLVAVYPHFAGVDFGGETTRVVP